MRLIDADALEKDLFPEGTSGGYWGFGQLCEMLDRQPTLEAIHKGVYEQVKWERDMAIQQLNDYGVQLGEKADLQSVVRCKDCVCSRELHEKEKWLYVEDTLMCGFFDRAVPNDGFCDNAERRGD